MFPSLSLFPQTGFPFIGAFLDLSTKGAVIRVQLAQQHRKGDSGDRDHDQHPALALTRTTEHGRACRVEALSHLKTFSGATTSKGTLHRRTEGHIVPFAYQRVEGARWHRFGPTRDSRKVFVSLDGTPFERINRHHRWREHFDINGFAGFPRRRGKLRARFIRQDGLSSSQVALRVRAAYGD